MTKRILLTLALSVLAVGVVFSQTETEQAEQIEQPKQTDFAGMTKNAITVWARR